MKRQEVAYELHHQQRNHAQPFIVRTEALSTKTPPPISKHQLEVYQHELIMITSNSKFPSNCREDESLVAKKRRKFLFRGNTL
jgi:hypothetical protein